MASSSAGRYAVLETKDLVETHRLVDQEKDAEVVLAPVRGGMVTRFRIGNDDILFLDQATLRDHTQNVRGGIPILFPVAGRLTESATPESSRRPRAGSTTARTCSRRSQDRFSLHRERSICSCSITDNPVFAWIDPLPQRLISPTMSRKQLSSSGPRQFEILSVSSPGRPSRTPSIGETPCPFLLMTGTTQFCGSHGWVTDPWRSRCRLRCATFHPPHVAWPRIRLRPSARGGLAERRTPG